MPKIFYASQEDVPADFREIAKAEDGKFVIDVVATAQLNDFRDRNIAISQERDSAQNLIAQLRSETGLDPDQLDAFLTLFKENESISKQVSDGKLVKDTSLQEALENRTKEMRTAHETQLREANTRESNMKNENSALRQRVDQSIIDKAITLVASDPKSGIRPDALRAVMSEAYGFFKVEDDKIIARNPDGSIRYGEDGSTPMTPKEFIKTHLAEIAPYVFMPSEGGGAGGGSGAGGQLTSDQLNNMSPEQLMNLARS